MCINSWSQRRKHFISTGCDLIHCGRPTHFKPLILFCFSFDAMDPVKDDAQSFHHMMLPFLKGGAQEDMLDILMIYIKKEANRRQNEENEATKISTLREDKPESLHGEPQAFPASPATPITKPVSNVDEVIQAILDAKANNTILRVVGSYHSVSHAIFPKEGQTLVLMGDLQNIEFKEVEEDGIKYLYSRVGAGCYLGKNPMDPLNSTLENSACYQISQKGYAFPELGGIIHQTVGGFIMTGSAGGSLKHGFADTIQEIEFVDGTGNLRVAKRGEELWCAVGVSMGLLGVITHVTFRLPPAKLIQGTETNYKFADSSLGPDKTGKSRLQESLKNNEYFRVNWFPQKYVQRVQEWAGEQTSGGEIIPYKSSLESMLAANTAAVILSVGDFILQQPHLSPLDYCIIGTPLKLFVPLHEHQKFRDEFYKTLPMDNQSHVDVIIKVDFTEIWMPIDQCQTVMDKLNTLFRDNQKAAGNFATEIYAAKESPFWLSMSYGGDMVRVDPYWWAYNRRDLRQFFTYFWDVLLDIPGTRLHWGKYLPMPGQTCGTKTFNLAYLKSVYPKMDKWLEKRAEMDPQQVFVTDYWRNILEIPRPK